jgi:hypothetical protein
VQVRFTTIAIIKKTAYISIIPNSIALNTVLEFSQIEQTEKTEKSTYL